MRIELMSELILSLKNEEIKDLSLSLSLFISLLSTMWEYKKKMAICKPESESYVNIKFADALISNIPAFRAVRTNFLKLVSPILLYFCYSSLDWLSNIYKHFLGLPGCASGKESACNAGDTGDVGSILGSGRSPGGGNGNPFQYSCLENLHGQRSLAGYRTWGHRELDTTEVT